MLYPTFETLERRALMASTISGTVFNDKNSNGLRDAREKGLAGQFVFLDSNSDGKYQKRETSLTTNANGKYAFTKLDAGTYRVCIKAGNAFRQTAPQGNVFEITTGGDELHAANDIGLTTTGVIRGSVFSDTNQDGDRQNDEAGIAGLIIFIDKNNDGEWQQGTEKARVTNIDGVYHFTGLKPGAYTIRIIKPNGATLTTPDVLQLTLKSGKSLSGQSFGLA